MGEGLSVDPERVREAARFVSDKAQTIGDALTKLHDTIGNELLTDGWKGIAADAFEQVWTDWKQGADAIVAALGDSSTKLADAADQYQTQDSDNAEAIGRAGSQV